ncbi:MULTISPECIES: NAD-dependent epimerase/dehydratase family protein [Nocardia]|uniref:NAD-dependent epimerase/dehydratase family protein n=1 Tax=Nocardia arthritidis TaxID=228602 RepID=A0A6G9YEP1_9NOCA|nr:MULTISPECIES: NAD(P)-dependent oxidoreductase [Nocardia]QIS11658.1 NAD-dependent epimerase/dehydratase family protein [Nocardia arthritidis]
MTQRILVTGAAGGIGTLMRPRLARPDRVLRLLDLRPLPPAGPGEAVELVTGSLTDPVTIAAACRDVDAIIHLGGISREDSWDRIVAANIDGTHTVLEAARQAGISRIVLASSNHAAGFAEIGAEKVAGEAFPRPDTYYGVSKAAVEALGSLYHSRFGMDVICVRIGSCFERPADLRGLSMWLSPDDCARLLEACLAAKSPGYQVIWGVSPNTRAVVSLREAEALGYRGVDDAERFAAEIDTDPANAPKYIGGPFCDTPLGKPNPL